MYGPTYLYMYMLCMCVPMCRNRLIVDLQYDHICDVTYVHCDVRGICVHVRVHNMHVNADYVLDCRLPQSYVTMYCDRLTHMHTRALMPCIHPSIHPSIHPWPCIHPRIHPHIRLLCAGRPPRKRPPEKLQPLKGSRGLGSPPAIRRPQTGSPGRPGGLLRACLPTWPARQPGQPRDQAAGQMLTAVAST